MTFFSGAQRLAVATALVFSVSAYAQAQEPMRIRGEIVSIDATTLTVKRSNGAVVSLAVTPTLAVGAVKNVKLADIAKGSYIGTATRTADDGKLVALEVLVFPESARGSGEGHYAWDLLPGSSMTNANVDAAVDGVKGRTLQLSYKGGEKQVEVPDNTPVVTFAPATRADLIAGKKVFVIANGMPSAMTAARVIVEKDGVAPPM